MAINLLKEISYKFWNKVTQGVTHSDTPVSSVSSWSLGAWAALEKHWAGDTGLVQQQGADSKSPKIPSPTKSSAGLSKVTKHSYSRHKTFLLLFFQQAFISWHFSPSPHFTAWCHPQLFSPGEKKIPLLMCGISSVYTSSNFTAGRIESK